MGFNSSLPQLVWDLKALLLLLLLYFFSSSLLPFNTNRTLLMSVIRASVPKMNLDDAFEQKNEIAKAVEDELEKVCVHHLLVF